LIKNVNPCLIDLRQGRNEEIGKGKV